MKNRIKRLTAAALLVCLMLSMVVPATFAEDNGAASLVSALETKYSFDLINSGIAGTSQLNAIKFSGQTKDDAGNPVTDGAGNKVTVKDFVDGLYAAGTLRWTYLDEQSGTAAVFRSGGIAMDAKVLADDWIALKLKSPGKDYYDISVTATAAQVGNTFDVYLMKYAADMDVGTALSGAEALKTGLGSASNGIIAENVELDNGEYVLVLKRTGVYTTDTSNYKKNRYTLCDLTLTVAAPDSGEQPDETTPDETTPDETVPEETTPETPDVAEGEKLYDFDLAAKDEVFLKKALTNWYEDQVLRVYDKIAQMYGEGTIHWKYETCSDSFTIKDATFRENFLRFKSSVNYDTVDNAWVAFRLESPGEGTYDVRIVCDDVSMICGNVYLIPASAANTMSKDAIQAAMTGVNLLVSNLRLDAAGEIYLGEYTFGSANEYVLVFDFTKGTTLFLSQLRLTEDGLLDDGTVPKDTVLSGTVYDFDLADQMNGIYSESTSYMADKLEDMNARYADGRLNWAFADASESLKGTTTATADLPNTNIRFYRATGMRIYNALDGWVAFKIKSPGSGDYTVTLNHATCANSGTLAMYILPADTQDIWEATDPTNRVGKVVLTNESGDTAIVDGSTSFVGYWNFEADKEYIVVMEAYENSRFNSGRCYMNISQMVMQAGKIPYDAEDTAKKVNSVTVAQNALPVADPGTYAAVTEVNGHDYYFLPLEGKYMLVYDLDTGELVDKVQTGINYPRHCAVGPDGRVYLIGASYFVFIYDPITKTSEKTPNIIGTEGMEEVQGLNALAIAEDGTIWLGAYYGAYIASYNLQKREYTNYGMPLGAQSSIKAIKYHKGYVYAGIHGESTHAVIKMDANTGEVVAQRDIAALMGTASYIHSLNMLGDDLLIAGGSGLSGMIAMDPDTLELVELNIPSYVNLDVTEAIDGKHYMVLVGEGLYAYDIATKTFEKVDIGSGGNGFRTGGQNSFGSTLVTINGDRCLFTYTASGGHPRFFNLDKKTYTTWDTLVKDGGGGSTLRGFVNWAEGTNRFSFGGFNTTLCAVYNTKLGKIEYYYNTGGQTDSQIWYEGKLYAGNYSSTTLNEIDPETNTYIERWRLDHALTGQKRIHTLAAGDGYIFAGTTPDSNLNGGGIVTYNVETKNWSFKRNVIENQSVNSLVYYDKLLYGTTTTSGGSGATAMGSAVVFVYDYTTEETLAVLDLRDYIDDLASPVTMVHGITADPNVEGRF